jgi:hypothetical protein
LGERCGPCGAWIENRGFEARLKAVAEKLILQGAAPEGAIDFAAVMASLKRCPDTNRPFFSSL